MRLVVGLIALLAASPVGARAQITAPADAPAPRAGLPGRYFRLEAMREGQIRMPAALARRVSVHHEAVLLQNVLLDIANQAGLGLSYSDEVARSGTKVTVDLDRVTAADALATVVEGTRWSVLVTPQAQVTVVRTTVRVSGTIVGRITDAKTGDPLVGADIALEGTRARATSGEKGYYRLADVAAGSYTLSVRRVGYAKQARTVVVTADQEVTADMALVPVATQLNELVTTVTGEQRRLELGHVVGVINADSVMKEAPVTNLAELLNGRVPGLQVFQNSGMVGGKVQLQIRSPNSINLSVEPLVVVDGVRYASGVSNTKNEFRAEPTSRLNDLNPNDIETIEIVKGPSAATLYGTDASNGVVVVTTKRGRVGPTRWNIYAKAAQNEIPLTRYPKNYFGYSDEYGSYSCGLVESQLGYCTQDSVALVPNPLNNPKTTILGNKPRWEQGINFSGGQSAFRYYFSGDFEQATGPFQMPKDAIERLKQQKGVAELRDEQLNPNTFTKGNLRANITSTVANNSDVRFQVGYTRSHTRTLSLALGSPYRAASESAPGELPYGGNYRAPEAQFSTESTEALDRFLLGGTGEWRALSWLQARASLGLDLADAGRYSLARRGDNLLYNSGYVANSKDRQLGVTGDVGATAVLRRGRATFRTSAGAQYVRTSSDAITATGSNLPPAGESVNQASTRSGSQTFSESVTLGSYLEETVGLNDRLFFTGAFRVDGASAFGRDYSAAVYPKVSASWIVSDEPFMPRVPGLEELRLRYAFGASGQQATSEMALPSFSLNQAIYVNGQAVPGISVGQFANPNLRPERVREHEFGLDAGGLNGRLRLGLTWFNRRTTDPIVSHLLPPGYGQNYINLGLVTGHGFEAEMTARIVESDPISWQVTLQHSLRRSKVVDLGDMPEFKYNTGGYVEGYPLGARFERRIRSYSDANGNGLLSADEVQLTDPVYVGESQPPQSQTLATSVGLFRQKFRLSALFERRAGFTQVNELYNSQCTINRCRGSVDPTASLAEQAEAVAAAQYYSPMQSGTFVRFRELSAYLELPTGLVRAMRLRTANFSVQVRNLALWTSFDGPDPESSTAAGYIGGAAINIPQGRTWTFRLDLGL